MLGLDQPPARIWVIWVQIQIFKKKKKFTIFHIEFAEKSQKIRTYGIRSYTKKTSKGLRKIPNMTS